MFYIMQVVAAIVLFVGKPGIQEHGVEPIYAFTHGGGTQNGTCKLRMESLGGSTSISGMLEALYWFASLLTSVSRHPVVKSTPSPASQLCVLQPVQGRAEPREKRRRSSQEI